MRVSRSLFAALLLATTPLAASTPVTLPDWMQQAMTQPKGTYSEEVHAVVLLSERSVSVISGEEYVDHERRVVRILRPKGRSEGTFGVSIQEGQKITNLHAWCQDSSGHNFELKQKEFAELNLSREELYNDDRTFEGKPSGVEVGSICAFEAEVVRHVFRPEIHWLPQEDIPVAKANFTAEFPAGYEYSTNWANTDVKKPVQLGPNRWQWSLSDIPPIEEEPMRLPAASLAQHLVVSYFGSGSRGSDNWGGVGTWYKGLVDPRRQATPELIEATHRITQGRSGFDAQMRAVANFLQRDIRYVAIEIGIGGQQPHFAGDIFKKRYGDCKDKAALMSTMLKELGYRSELVIVDTKRGFIKPGMPSMWGNHAIIAIEAPAEVPDDAYPALVKTKAGKRYVIFDPTNEFVPFGFIPSYEQDNYVLIASDPGELVRLPLFAPEINGTETSGKFTLGTDGVLSGEVAHKLRGDEASRIRRRLNEADGTDRTKFVELVANASLKQTLVEKPQFEFLKDIDHELLIRYDLKMSGYAQNTGGLLLVRPRVLGDRALHLQSKPRKYAIELSGTRHEHDEYEITLPSGYVIDELPDNTKVDVGFASYESKIETKGNVLHYTRDYVVRDPHIELTKINDLKKLENAIALDEFATAILKKAP